MAFGLALRLWWLLLLPQQQTAPASATGPGNLFGADAAISQVTSATTGENWQEMSPVPVRRAGMGVTAYGDEIYAIGGMTDHGPERTGRYL
jgi:hypothetical protein